jgi:TetR/AcrR family transcriptional repressor of nem operon
MPRTREFSETEALDQAMEVFWSKGYEATTLQDLIFAMGISKSSFYETFGNKHELLLSAIENYVETKVEAVVKLLDGEPSGKKAIEDIFGIYIESCEKGCFLCNCSLELSRHDPAVAEKIAGGMARIEEAYCRAVTRGQGAGEIPPGRDARALARYLLNSENGIFISAQAGLDREALKDVVQVVLSVLK